MHVAKTTTLDVDAISNSISISQLYELTKERIKRLDIDLSASHSDQSRSFRDHQLCSAHYVSDAFGVPRATCDDRLFALPRTMSCIIILVDTRLAARYYGRLPLMGMHFVCLMFRFRSVPGRDRLAQSRCIIADGFSGSLEIVIVIGVARHGNVFSKQRPQGWCTSSDDADVQLKTARWGSVVQ